MMEVSYVDDSKYVDIEFTAGMFVERDAWLGNYLNSFEGGKNNKDSATQYFTVGISKEISSIKIALSATNGITRTNSASDNIKNIGTVLSYSWNASVEKSFGDNGTVGVMTYQPVSVYRAEAELVAPVGLDENFEVVQNSKASLAADVKELRTGAYYKVNNRRDTNLLVFTEYRKDFRGQQGVNDFAAGIVLTKKF
jgi:hypothetical protein